MEKYTEAFCSIIGDKVSIMQMRIECNLDPAAYEKNFDTLPRLKSWDSTSTRSLADPVLHLSVTEWCPIRAGVITQGSPFELIPYDIC